MLGQVCRQRTVGKRGTISEGPGWTSRRLRPERNKAVTPVKALGGGGVPGRGSTKLKGPAVGKNLGVF